LPNRGEPSLRLFLPGGRRVFHAVGRGALGGPYVMQRILLRRLAGPGLVFTGAAIGTSHLVQSTRAGAMFGAALIGVIVLANLLKYPAFRFGVDFSHARRQSLLSGYRELGRWVPVLFLILVIPLVPIIWAALSAATAGIVSTVFGPVLPIPVMASLILVAASALLLLGGYRLLDKVNAVMLAFLVLSTLITTAMVVPRVEWATLGDFTWTRETTSLLFIVALAGFMPNPMDLSVPLSLWKVEADRTLPPGSHPSIGQARAGLRWPYVMTAFMAVCFCVMGAGVMHPQGIAPLSDAPGFAAQVVNLYREALGPGAAVLAAIAALSVMLTTVIAAVDAYCRTLPAAIAVWHGDADATGTRRAYVASCVVLVSLAIASLFTLMSEFTVLLDFVISATFVVAPVIALLNHLVVTRCDMPEDARPSPVVRAWNWIAIAVMTTLAVMYFVLTLG
jgi:Mn2+/Fe2+ NRAMP family transporter